MIGAFGDGVFGGQEQGLVVGGPFERGHALGGVGKGLAGAEILHVKSVLAVAGDVGGIGQQVRVIADRKAPRPK